MPRRGQSRRRAPVRADMPTMLVNPPVETTPGRLLPPYHPVGQLPLPPAEVGLGRYHDTATSVDRPSRNPQKMPVHGVELHSRTDATASRAPDLEISLAIRIIAVRRRLVEIVSAAVAVPEDAAIAVRTCAGN